MSDRRFLFYLILWGMGMALRMALIFFFALCLATIAQWVLS